MLGESVGQCVVVDDGTLQRIRSLHGLSGDRRLRVAYVAGPGDVAGTFEHWANGQFDPRTPVIAYSTQFYSLVEKLGAEALVLAEPGVPAGQPHPRIRFVHTPRRRDRGRIGRRIEEARFGARVLRELRRFDPDVVVIGTDAPPGLLRGLPRRARVVLTAHNTFWPIGRRPASPRARLGQAARARALGRVAAAVCTSPACRDQLVELTGREEGLRVELPQVLRGHAGTGRWRDGVRQVLFLGRIEADKGVLDLVEAFDAVAGAHPELRLRIAGAGSAEAELRRRVAAARHGGRIEVLGQVPADRVHALLEEADLLACPTRGSFAEGLALVVIEAAMHGVPSVLSSVVPAKDYFPGGVVEFPADDLGALRAALEEVVASPARHRALQEALRGRTDRFLDRSLSWGSQLARVLAPGG